ncbi:MAG: hypothetical protein Q4C98_11765, partial [Capnocytophaga sp.]|nr:hypothetical protein [Capnocytophaga sp.]
KRIHPLGYINLDKNYKCFIIEIRQVANVFIDIYVFDFNGNITSFLELYEESSFIIDYNKREPRDDEYERI